MDMVKIPDTSDISQCEMTTASIGGDNKPVSVAGVNPPLRYTLSCTMLHWSIVARANAKRGSVCEQYMKRIFGVRIFTLPGRNTERSCSDYIRRRLLGIK